MSSRDAGKESPARGLSAPGNGDNATTSTKRATTVGNPVPQPIPLPASGDAVASTGAAQMGDAITIARDSGPPLQSSSRAASQALVVALPDDFFYDKEDFKATDVSATQMPEKSLSLFYNFGFESYRRNNLHFLNEYTVLTAVGNVLVFINVKTLEQDYMPGLRDGAIGSIAVHPSRKYIAVGESCDSSPNIYIFEYPSLKLYRVLREGAEKGYSNLTFNAAGDKIASVGMDPDYMLTIWDWKRESVILRSKAFSQDIYTVAFSPESDGQLTTSGMGHIKFWRMASTFTGLKLQGYIGKFGLSELTDIVTFIQLPDGKVLSSTETGNLLLWDGGMIKCELATKGKLPCHQGPIEVITLVDGEVFTAGEDGYVRIWDLDTIDSADVATDAAPQPSTSGSAPEGEAPAATSSVPQARVCEIEPLDEIQIGKDVKIKSMIRCLGENSEYLIQDALGHLFSLDIQSRGIEKVMSFHSGSVASVDSSPSSHSMASLGADGALKLYDYITKAVIATATYPGGGTTMTYLPESLDIYGCTLAAGFANGVLRIISHTVAGHGVDDAEFKLQFVFKPHTTAITSIGVSADGTHLATTSADKTVFFFKIDATQTSEDETPAAFSHFTARITPLGFITLDSVPVKLSFSPDNHLNIDEIEPIDENAFEDPEAMGENGDQGVAGKRAFVVLDSGELVSLIVPEPAAIDNSLSYELPKEQLQLKPWKLDVPPVVTAAKPAAKEEELGSANSEAPGPPPETPESRPESLRVNGHLTSAARKAHGLVVDTTSPVTDVMYLEGGYFLLSLTNKDGEAEIRACKYSTPRQSRLVLVYKAKFSDMRLSTSGKYLLAGAVDGMSCVRKFRLEDILLYRWAGGHEAYSQYCKAFEAEATQTAALRASNGKPDDRDYADSQTDLTIMEDVPGQYWFGHAHSSKSGRVTSVAATFDDSFFFTAGADGGLFVWRIMLERIKSSGIDPPADPVPVGDPVADILEPTAYALQDAKIKSEKDKELEDAERKKQVTRQYMRELRMEFLKLVAENEKMPAEEQLPRSALTVDPDLRSDIEKETEKKIELVRKELEWISAKESVIPTKLRKRFLDPLQTERLEVHAFRTSHMVTTFRTIKPEHALDVVLQPLGNAETRSSRAAAFALENSVGAQNKEGRLEGQDHELVAQTNKAGKGLDAKNKLEARKQLRAQRAIKWKELMDAKPDENYEDPRDVAAIRYAEQHMGDYKLKTGEKYIVPESERVDADKKRRQILLLKDSVFSLKENFNQSVLGIKEHKAALIEQIRTGNEQLGTINAELESLEVGGAKQSLWTPTMEAAAYPEKRYEVTPADIAQLRKDDKQAVSEAKGNQEEGFGGFGGGSGVQSKETPPAAAAPTAKSRPGTVGSMDRLRPHTPDPLGFPADIELDLLKVPHKSALQLREEEIRIKQLLYKRDRIHTAINQAVEEFDKSLHMLVKEKVVLEGDLKSADIKLLLLYREWVLLKEFEKHDNFLADKLVQKRSEKNDIDNKIKECQEKLNGKKSDIEVVIKKEKEVQEEFRQIVGENNKHDEFLTKIFKKKIKRSKKKPKTDSQNADQDGEGEVEEEEDNDDNDDMDDLDEEESVSEENDADDAGEECPSDYDPASFARILALREDRLDQEDILVEIQKTVDVLKKENDALIKKEKISDQALRTTENEIQEFQTQKQQKLNELDVVVPLRLHQLQYLEKQSLPADLSGALVFMNQGLAKLRRRIKELQQEKADIRRQHKELRKMHVSLVKSRKEKHAKLQELEARAVDVQMLKFGQIIDLEKLERMGVNKNADELREKLAKEDSKRLKEVEELQVEVLKLREELTEVTKDNTVRLEQLVDLTDTKQTLEEGLNAAQLSVTAEYSGPQHRDIVERQHLISLVQTQAQEIDDLKREIEMLIRKPMRQLPPIARGRAHTTVPPTADPMSRGGLVTGQGIMMGTFENRSMPTTVETVAIE